MGLYAQPYFALYLHLSIEIFIRDPCLRMFDCPKRYYAQNQFWQLYLQILRMAGDVEKVCIVRPGWSGNKWDYFDHVIVKGSADADHEQAFVTAYGHVLGEVIEVNNGNLSHILW